MDPTPPTPTTQFPLPGQVGADDRFIRRCVLALWLLLSAALLFYVAMFARNIPFSDEWNAVVPFITGSVPTDWAHLAQRHNEHQILLPRIAFLLIGKLSGYDFRIPMWLSAVSLIAAARLAELAMRRARGHASWLDALPALLFLNFGHEENLLIGFQLQFVLIALTTVAMAWLMIRTDPQPDPRPEPQPTLGPAVAGAAAMVLLPFCSVGGALISLGATPWLALLALDRFKHSPGRGRAQAGLLILCTALAVTCGLLGLPWHVKPHAPSPVPPRPVPPWAFIAVQGNALGLAARLAPLLFGAIVVACILVTLAATLRVLRKPRHWPAWGGLWGLAAGLVLIAAGIAHARFGHAGAAPAFAPRYYTLMAPLLIVLALLLTRFATARAGTAVIALLLLVEAALWPAQAWVGWKEGSRRWAEYASFRADVVAGMPLSQLANRHAQAFYNTHDPGLDIPLFLDAARRLHDRGIGLFAAIRLDPPAADSQPISATTLPAPPSAPPQTPATTPAAGS